MGGGGGGRVGNKEEGERCTQQGERKLEGWSKCGEARELRRKEAICQSAIYM